MANIPRGIKCTPNSEESRKIPGSVVLAHEPSVDREVCLTIQLFRNLFKTINVKSYKLLVAICFQHNNLWMPTFLFLLAPYTVHLTLIYVELLGNTHIQALPVWARERKIERERIEKLSMFLEFGR